MERQILLIGSAATATVRAVVWARDCSHQAALIRNMLAKQGE